eukprot:233499-Chlamydomonas_euryale.AAC.3
MRHVCRYPPPPHKLVHRRATARPHTPSDGHSCSRRKRSNRSRRQRLPSSQFSTGGGTTWATSSVSIATARAAWRGGADCTLLPGGGGSAGAAAAATAAAAAAPRAHPRPA